ncbi:hypothetical protein Tco_0899891 [Tanacetum coccineum]
MDSKLTRTIKIKEMRVESLVGLINGKWLLQVCYNSYNESPDCRNSGDARSDGRTVAMPVNTTSGDGRSMRTVASRSKEPRRTLGRTGAGGGALVTKPSGLMANGGDKVDGGRARTGGDMVRKLKVWEWEG